MRQSILSVDCRYFIDTEKAIYFSYIKSCCNVFNSNTNDFTLITSDGANITVDKKASTIKENAPPVISTEETTSSYSAHNVYITKSGSKYHSLGCQYLKKSQIEISLQDATSRGKRDLSRVNVIFCAFSRKAIQAIVF